MTDIDEDKVKSQNSILTFFANKITFLGLHAVVATCEDLTIDVSMTTVGLILMKLRWFQHFSQVKIQIKIQFWPFLKRKENFWVFML